MITFIGEYNVKLDDKGRVIKLADANFVRNFDKDVRQKVYKILYNEFNGKNPNSEK